MANLLEDGNQHRTHYAIRLSELPSGDWLIDLAPDGKHGGLTLRAPTPMDALAVLADFLWSPP